MAKKNSYEVPAALDARCRNFLPTRHAAPGVLSLGCRRTEGPTAPSPIARELDGVDFRGRARAAPREKILDLRFQSEDRMGCAQAAALPRAAPFLLVHSFDDVNRRSLSAGSITVDI